MLQPPTQVLANIWVVATHWSGSAAEGQLGPCDIPSVGSLFLCHLLPMWGTVLMGTRGRAVGCDARYRSHDTSMPRILPSLSLQFSNAEGVSSSAQPKSYSIHLSNRGNPPEFSEKRDCSIPAPS